MIGNRGLAAICLTALVIPGLADAQPVQQRPIAARALELANYQLPRTGTVPRCCNPRGALVGAAIGAAVAVWVTLYTCDAGDCTGHYVKNITVFGGIGAGLGAFADQHSQPGAFPAALPKGRPRASGARIQARVLRIRF